MDINSRITFVSDSFVGGGKERRCLQIVQGLNKAGIKHIQFIIINDTIAYPEIYKTTAKIIVINRKQSGLSNWQTYKTLKKHINEFKPDIIQGWGILSLFLLNWLRITKKFIYISSDVADANKPKGINKIIFSCTNLLANAIIGNSQAGLKAYGVPKKKAYCIYNGYNAERLKKAHGFDVNVFKEELGIHTPYVVTMVARVDENKDYHSFIEIANEICLKRNDITFLAVGQGILLDKYKEETKNQEYIKFVGFRSDIEKILSITSVSVLCSNIKKHQEGVSNAILESMALGVPVVATYGGGTPEIIDNGINGFCIKDNVINDFVDNILLLINNKQTYDSFSASCKEKVANKFLLENSVKRYVDLYEKLLNK